MITGVRRLLKASSSKSFAWPRAGYAQPVALSESAPMLRRQTITNNEYLLRGHSACTSFSTTAHVTYKWERWENENVRPNEKRNMQKEVNRSKRSKVNTELRRWRGIGGVHEDVVNEHKIPHDRPGTQRGIPFKHRKPRWSDFFERSDPKPKASNTGRGKKVKTGRSPYTGAFSSMSDAELEDIHAMFEAMMKEDRKSKPFEGAFGFDFNMSDEEGYYQRTPGSNKSDESGGSWRSSREQRRGSAGAGGIPNYTFGHTRPPDPQQSGWCRLLGLPPDGALTQQTVKAAFREQAFKWHPDLYSGDHSKKHAEEKFKAAQVAYEGLLSRCQT